MCAYVCSVHGVWSPCCAYIRSICEMAYGICNDRSTGNEQYVGHRMEQNVCWMCTTEARLSAHTVTDATATIASVARKIKEFFISFLFVSHSHRLQFYSVCSAFGISVGRRSCDEKGKHICCRSPGRNHVMCVSTHLSSLSFGCFVVFVL